MDGRRARLIDARRGSVPAIPRAPLVRVRPTGERLRVGWALALGLGWPLTFVVGAALEPVPAEPDAAVPVAVALAALVFLATLTGTVMAAAVRHPLAAPVGVAAGVVSLAFSVACPVTGHHALGLWWVAQMAITVAMLGVCVAALGRHARTSA